MSPSFLSLCTAFQEIEETSSRLKIQEILAQYIKKCDKRKYETIFYLCTGMIYPSHDERELNIGEAQIVKIISDMSMKNVKIIQGEYQKIGDLGTIAIKYKINTLFKSRRTFDIDEILEVLREIAEAQGKDSNQARSRLITKVLIVLTDIEKKYFIRLLECKLKIGLALQTVLIAFAMIMFPDDEIEYSTDKSLSPEDMADSNRRLNEKGVSKENPHKKPKKKKPDSIEEPQPTDPITIFKAAYDRCCEIGVLLDIWKQSGLVGLRKMGIVGMKPFRPMLCMPLSSFSVDFNSFICEIKYDGERIQIHKKDDKIIMYSRNGENNTKKYPELVETIKKQSNNFVIDAEVVAFDRENEKILPFQVLAKRKKKKTEENQVEICLFIFDILSLNDNSLLSLALGERREIMIKNIKTDFIIRFSHILSRFEDEKSYFAECAVANNETNASFRSEINTEHSKNGQGMQKFASSSDNLKNFFERKNNDPQSSLENKIINVNQNVHKFDAQALDSTISDMEIHTHSDQAMVESTISNLKGSIESDRRGVVAQMDHINKQSTPESKSSYSKSDLLGTNNHLKSVTTEKKPNPSLLDNNKFDNITNMTISSLKPEQDSSQSKTSPNKLNERRLAQTDNSRKDPLSFVEWAFNESMNRTQEGVLIKNLKSCYIPNKRSNNWLKLKKDYLSMADTLDLIVMGAYYGKGKRTGVFGGFLMGCLSNEKYEPVCRLGTGFDENMLILLKNKLRTTDKKPSIYFSSVEPDIWIEPELVFEVNAAEISTSPLYATEISLRFPRFVRIRYDKTITDVTELAVIQKMMQTN